MEETINTYDALADYTPEEVKDSFDVIKGKFNVLVDSARLQDYDGPTDELKGHRQVKMDTIIDDGQKYAGRHLFKTFDLSRPGKTYTKKDGTTAVGKSGQQQIADTLWTCGLSWKVVPGNKEETEKNLMASLAKLTEMKLAVRAGEIYRDASGNFVSKKKAGEGAEPIQTVKILGKADAKGAEATASTPSF
jgi:hypothetical protein